MKKLLFIIVTLLLVGLAMAQGPVFTSYVEQTIVSPKAGIALGLKNQYHVEYGVFYQESSIFESSFMSEQRRANLPRNYEKVFWGGFVAFPIINRSSGEILFNIRTGVVNAESFVITPSLLGSFKLIGRVHLGGGIGIRAFSPTFQTRISLGL